MKHLGFRINRRSINYKKVQIQKWKSNVFNQPNQCITYSLCYEITTLHLKSLTSILHIMWKIWSNTWVIRRELNNIPPFINQISFVSHKDNNHIAATFCTYFLDPLCGIEKWLSNCITNQTTWLLSRNN